MLQAGYSYELASAVEEAENSFWIENTPGVELPSTGGAGTALFTALGGLMMAAAGAILMLKSYRRRKKNA